MYKRISTPTYIARFHIPAISYYAKPFGDAQKDNEQSMYIPLYGVHMYQVCRPLKLWYDLAF